MALTDDTCGHDGCVGKLRWERDDYGSLGDGGSCEVYKCDTCGKTYHFELPD